MTQQALSETHLPNREPVARGKVRDIYDLGDRLVIVATDRLSAFDWVNPVPIPDKGRVLTQMSLFWFDQIKDIVDTHLVSADLADFPEDFRSDPEQFAGRSMLVRKCQMFSVEFVVRGYLAGSAWKEYRATGTVCGHKLPAGLLESSKLEQPIFTPATKATDGHDLNISPEQAAGIIGKDLLEMASRAALDTYLRGRAIAGARGIILCDTKFEFGLCGGRVVLADEVMTPDSSRFWPADQYRPGGAQPSYDKQYVRDHLEAIGWDKTPPAPALPPDVVEKTRTKYLEAFRLLTGRPLA